MSILKFDDVDVDMHFFFAKLLAITNRTGISDYDLMSSILNLKRKNHTFYPKKDHLLCFLRPSTLKQRSNV